jgi:hypothetical protein
VGIEDVVFPEDTNSRKHDLPEDNIPGSPLKRRRVLSFVGDIVDDSEGEDRDFWLTEIENIETEKN